jgi:hypothetical protein
MNSLEQFFHILYHYDLAKEENRRKGRTTPVISPKLTMSFDFPDVDPPISNAPHETLSDAEVEGQKNLYKDNKDNDNNVGNGNRSRSRSSSPDGPLVSDDEVTSTSEDDEDDMTSESDSTSSQTPPSRKCYHPKHRVYRKKGLTTNTFVKITKNLALIIGINDDLIICRGCMKQSHRDTKV